MSTRQLREVPGTADQANSFSTSDMAFTCDGMLLGMTQHLQHAVFLDTAHLHIVGSLPGCTFCHFTTRGHRALVENRTEWHLCIWAIPSWQALSLFSMSFSYHAISIMVPLICRPWILGDRFILASGNNYATSNHAGIPWLYGMCSRKLRSCAWLGKVV